MALAPGIRPRQAPLPVGQAVRATARCVVVTAKLLVQRRIHLPRRHVGWRLHFADGTQARVYRETVIDRRRSGQPAVLLVTFRLRGVHGAPAHALFRLESILNTVLFAGFPGMVSKLWLAHDGTGAYRGLYQWDEPALAQDYARALWRVLALVSHRDSISYHVLAGLTRDELLRDPGLLGGPPGAQWWRLIEVEQAAT